jgi:ABC-type transport system involved in multi-copper enzyme maturation permease subunit
MSTLTAPAPTAGGTGLLHYRPYRGRLRGPMAGVWAIARSGLQMLLRRKLFWGLYGLCLMVFLFFFFGQYIMAWLSTNLTENSFRLGSGTVNLEPSRLVATFRNELKINGGGETYLNVIWYEGYLVMIVLALAGAVLVGNDFRFGSLPFYLSKPLGRWHYVLGKCLAVAAFVNLMTTLLALVLWVEYGLLDSWSYFWDSAGLAVGIVGYGAVLTVVLSLLLLATASGLRRTVPMVMVWTALFVFARGMSEILVRVSGEEVRWRLIDLWSNMYVIGRWCMGVAPNPAYPSAAEAALVLTMVCCGCLIYLSRRIRAVEVV